MYGRTDQSDSSEAQTTGGGLWGYTKIKTYQL